MVGGGGVPEGPMGSHWTRTLLKTSGSSNHHLGFPKVFIEACGPTVCSLVTYRGTASPSPKPCPCLPPSQ